MLVRMIEPDTPINLLASAMNASISIFLVIVDCRGPDIVIVAGIRLCIN